MSLRITKNKLPDFQRSLFGVLDDALKEAGRDTLIKAKQRAPYKKGGLRGQTEVDKKSRLLWRVSFWMEYARFQEFGGDGKRQVRNYSTGGTGAHYLKNAGDEQKKRLVATIKKHAMRAKA